jgi:predicted nucleic acid-binding protein
MAIDRLFVDSAFLLALFNRRDQHHERAHRLLRSFEQCRELWTTEAVMLEVAAAFRAPGQRPIAVRLWDQFHCDPRCSCVAVSGDPLREGVDLFRDRPDKSWSLTDCISFVVMSEHQLTAALTNDHHFVQAGFRALLLEESPAP